jgi:DNA helicase MCM8
LSFIGSVDIVFILIDSADVQTDRNIARHILNTTEFARGSVTPFTQTQSAATAHAGLSAIDDNMTFSQKLEQWASFYAGTRANGGQGRLISTQTLRRYIEYASSTIHPALSKPAAKVLQKFYLRMRSESTLGLTIPVTTRHLESLIRLSQARAKLELRDLVCFNVFNL